MKLFSIPSSTEWMLFIEIFGAIVLFLGLVELLRFLFHGSHEITRKTVHVVIGILIFFSPQLFTSGIPPLVFSAIFTIITLVTVHLGILKSIHGTKRKSFGTVYYPFALFLLILLFWEENPRILSISMLILALADAAAGIVGENLRKPHQYRLTSDSKSIEGSFTMFIVSMGTVYGSLEYLYNSDLHVMNQVLLISILTAVFVTVWEAISSRGFDNFTIPLSAAFILHFLTESQFDSSFMIYGMVLGVAISVSSYKMRLLTIDGAIATFLLATTIFSVGRWEWTIPILTFFIFSSILSKIGKQKKKTLHSIVEKHDIRDLGQVAANGGIAGILILIHFYFPEDDRIYMYFLGSIAAVTSDTWATEIGTLWKGKPRSIVTFHPVDPGTSGGVSLQGIIGGGMGALLIIFSASLIHGNTFSTTDILIVLAAGVIGSLVDSIMGATVQAMYQNPKTGEFTEIASSQNDSNILIRGFSFIDNDMVNWCCAIAGALSVYLLL